MCIGEVFRRISSTVSQAVDNCALTFRSCLHRAVRGESLGSSHVFPEHDPGHEYGLSDSQEIAEFFKAPMAISFPRPSCQAFCLALFFALAVVRASYSPQINQLLLIVFDRCFQGWGWGERLLYWGAQSQVK